MLQLLLPNKPLQYLVTEIGVLLLVILWSGLQTGLSGNAL